VVAGWSSAGAFLNGDHADRMDVRFAHPNIQIYDAHAVDLYQRVCARYLVGVTSGEAKAKRSYVRLSTGFQNGSRSLSKSGPAQNNPGINHFNMIWRRECQSILKDKAFSPFLDQNPPSELPPENGISPSTNACPAQWPVIDNSAIKRQAKGKLPSPLSLIAVQCRI
jgi:hypothetical protein